MKKAEIERKEKQAKLEEDLTQRLQEKQAELADLDKKGFLVTSSFSSII